jgi:crotonobetainyl-CoA:carnitine CoA-transferase CaiB-like acyl-CoA transferase
MSAAATLPKGILSGVRILDFTWKTVGPWAPRLLTHFGAEVIHVERVGSWDDHRYAAHPSPIIEGPQKEFTQGAGPLHGGGQADGKKPYYATPYFTILHHGKLAISRAIRS